MRAIARARQRAGRLRGPWRARGAAALALGLLLLAGAARAGDPSSARRRLDAYEQRTRVEDLRTSAERRLQSQRLRATGDPGALDRARQRWQDEDARRDVARDREKAAIAAEAQREAAGSRPEARPGGPSMEGSDTRLRELDARLREIERRERLERLRRDAPPAAGPDPTPGSRP